MLHVVKNKKKFLNKELLSHIFFYKILAVGSDIGSGGTFRINSCFLVQNIASDYLQKKSPTADRFYYACVYISHAFVLATFNTTYC